LILIEYVSLSKLEMKFKLIVVFTILTSLGLNGQVTFQSYLSTVQPDRKLYEAHSLWEHFIRNYSDSLRFLAADLYHFGEVNKHKSSQIFSKRILGCYLVRKGDFRNGEKELKTALIFHRKNGDKVNETEDLNELGIANFLKGDYHSAQSFFQRSLQIGKEVSEKKYMILAELNLAKTFDKLNLIDRAEAIAKHYLRECQILKKYESVSNAYGFLSDLALNAKKIKLAKEYLNKSLKASLLTDNKLILAQVYANLGAFAAESNDFGQAKIHFQKSLDIRQKMNHVKGIIEANFNLAYLEYIQNNFLDAEKLFLHTLEIARKNEFHSDQVDALEMLVEIQKALKNKELEVTYLKEYLDAKSKQAEILYQNKHENEQLIDYFEDEKISGKSAQTINHSSFWTGFLIGFSSLLLILLFYHLLTPRLSELENRNYDE